MKYLHYICLTLQRHKAILNAKTKNKTDNQTNNDFSLIPENRTALMICMHICGVIYGKGPIG